MFTGYTFEFARTYQFTEEEIKEYIVKNEITDINKITIEDLISFTCEKYKISGWGDDVLESNSQNDEYDFERSCAEIIGALNDDEEEEEEE